MNSNIKINEYIKQHGKTENLTNETDTVNNKPKMREIYIINENDDYNGVFLDWFNFTLTINGNKYYLPCITPYQVQGKLLDIFKDEEYKILIFFNIPKNIAKRITHWWVNLPKNNGWLSIGYKYTLDNGLLIEDSRSG